MKGVIRMLMTAGLMLSVVNISFGEDLTRPKALELLKKHYINYPSKDHRLTKIFRKKNVYRRTKGLEGLGQRDAEYEKLMNLLAIDGYVKLDKEFDPIDKTDYLNIILNEKFKPFIVSEDDDWVTFRAATAVPVEITEITQGQMKDRKIVKYTLKIIPNELNKYLVGDKYFTKIKEGTINDDATFKPWDGGWRIVR